MQRLIEAAKELTRYLWKVQDWGGTYMETCIDNVDEAIAELQAADEKSELEQLRAENKKLRDALQELLDFSDTLQGRYFARSMKARFNAGALLNPEADSENQKRD